MDELYEKHLKTADDVMESAKNPEIVAQVEHTVILWCKNIEKVLALSKQMRKETDDMGPTGENENEFRI
jgi:dynein heavy chain